MPSTSPQCTKPCHICPKSVGVNSPSNSAPRYTSSEIIHAPTFAAAATTAARMSSRNTAPVGLLGLQMVINLVFSRDQARQDRRH